MEEEEGCAFLKFWAGRCKFSKTLLLFCNFHIRFGPFSIIQKARKKDGGLGGGEKTKMEVHEYVSEYGKLMKSLQSFKKFQKRDLYEFEFPGQKVLKQ